MEMKKYMTPEMEIVELKYSTTLLAGSGVILGRRTTSASRPRFFNVKLP